MNFSSKLLEDAVVAFSSLPGIGKKSALRLALYLMNQEQDVTQHIADALVQMRKNIKKCKQCYNISDNDVCNICANPRREKNIICIVESIRDVMAIEETSQFRGLYHVLDGVISPIEGIGPADLNIVSLIDRIKKESVKEIIMAISPTIEGDTTIFYISKQLKDLPVKISVIARGVSFGGELEYADELTLGRSIAARTPYQNRD